MCGTDMPDTATDVLSRRAVWSVDHADAREWSWRLPKNSIHCVVTSPPYFGLRDYGVDGQIGLEKTPQGYVEGLVEVFRGLRRALHPSGVLWLNLGDSYAGGGGYCDTAPSSAVSKSGAQGRKGALRDKGVDSCGDVKAKDLFGIPWMVAFALRADGWYLRQHCPWIKRNGMPESADDRPSTACEEVFLLSKEPDYYFDMEAVRRTGRSSWNSAAFLPDSEKDKANAGKATAATGASRANGSHDLLQSRNFRSADLWFDSVGMLLADDGTPLGFDVPVVGDRRAHFAIMPKRLISPMILAGTSAHGVCPHCGAPWVRVVEKERTATRPGADTKTTGDSLTDGNRDPQRHATQTKTKGWESSCDCADNTPVPAVVCDPFTGSGTVLAVAKDKNRRAVGCELNPEYTVMARKRIGAVDQPLF